MPAAHFLGLCPGLVLAQHPDDLLLAEATPFHRPSPFQATDSTSFRLSFRGAGQLASSRRPRIIPWTNALSAPAMLSPSQVPPACNAASGSRFVTCAARTC